MSDIFVSYARADRDRVAQLAHALEARGFDVWWDPELLPGQEYAAEIGGVLRSAKAVIVAWTANSVDRSWVLDEAAVGRDRAVLVPVFLDGSDAPLGFRQVEGFRLGDWTGAADHPGFQALVAKLTALRGAAAAAPPPAASVEPPRKRFTAARWAIAGAVVAAVGLAALAANQALRPPPVAIDPAAQSPRTPAGASERYGLTEEELNGFAPENLAEITLSKTTLEVLETQGGDDPLGQSLACLAYAFGGPGAPQDLTTARARCETAEQGGSPLATYMLSRFVRAGDAGFAADAAEADRLLARAADQGDPRAIYSQGRMALDAGDFPTAVSQTRRAAELGHYPAQVLLGWMYENGQGVAQSVQDAYRWYDNAAQKAYAPGLTAVGRLIEEGRGAPQSFEGARARYEEAAPYYGEAAYRLALMHARGLGGPADPERAEALLRSAVALGYEPAQAELDSMTAPPPTAEDAPAQPED